MISVSLPAIVLLIYYVCVWDAYSEVLDQFCFSSLISLLSLQIRAKYRTEKQQKLINNSNPLSKFGRMGADSDLTLERNVRHLLVTEEKIMHDVAGGTSNRVLNYLKYFYFV